MPVRAVVCHEYGPPDVVRVEEVPDPRPRTDGVLVKVAAAAVNFPDVLLIANKYQVPMPVPFTPGSEFAGVVVEVGAAVTSLEVGDRVFGATMVGAFAEYVAAPADALRRVPDGVDLSLTAGFWVAHATAYHALRSVGEAASGQKVVVLGAAGGVGLAAVELAAVMGCEVIAAASSSEKLAVCRARGASHIIDYGTEDFRSSLRAIAPDGVDVVIDPVGGPLAEQALRSTRWGGRFVTVGFASGEIPRIALNLVLLKGVVVKGFEIRTFADFAPEAAERDETELMELFASGRIAPHVSARYPLAEASEALRDVAERRAIGKVLVVP